MHQSMAKVVSVTMDRPTVEAMPPIRNSGENADRDPSRRRGKPLANAYSTVTDLARFRGLSMS